MVFTNQNGEDTNQIGRFEVLDVILHRHFMDKWEDDCEVDAVIYEVGLHDMGHILTFAANYRRNCSGKAANNVKLSCTDIGRHIFTFYTALLYTFSKTILKE